MKRLCIAAAVIVVTSGVMVSTTQAGPMEHIDQLAYSVKRQASRLGRQLRYEHSHNRYYRRLRADAYATYKLADHISDIIYRPSSLRHVRDDLAELDNRIHDLESLIRRAARSSRTRFDDGIRDRNDDHGHDHDHGTVDRVNDHGHDHGRHSSFEDFSEVRRTVRRMQDMVHHLESDVARLVRSRSARRFP